MHHYLVLLSLFAIEGFKLETQRQILMNFNRRNLAKENAYPLENYWATLKQAVYAGGY